MLFIEAFRKIDVSIGIRVKLNMIIQLQFKFYFCYFLLQGISGIKGTTLQVIKDTDIPKVFTVKQQEEYDIKENQFVKIKNGVHMPYSGDIGQILQIYEDNR